MIRTLLIALTVSHAVFAQSAIDDRCERRSASPDRSASIRRWAAAKETITAPEMRNGVFLLHADDRNAPFDHPFDLAGRTLRFRRQNASTFSVTNEALAYDNNLGARRSVVEATPFALPFDFPFFARTLKTIFLTRFGAVYSQAPQPNLVDQYGADELAAQETGVIAPLLTTASDVGSGADVWTRTTSDRAIITWIQNDAAAAWTVQLVLFSNGDIACSYRQVNDVLAGSIVITPGRAAFPATTVATIDDAKEDVVAGLDIESATISQLSGLGLIEFRMTMREAPDTSGLSSIENLRYTVRLGNGEGVTYLLWGDGTEVYSVPVWGDTLRNPAARIEGRTVVLDVMADYIGIAGGGTEWVEFRTSSNTHSTLADSAATTVTFTPMQHPVLTHFKDAATPVEVSDFAAEAFTLPILDPFGAWDEIRTAYNIDERAIDGVAFYQTFTTDIVFYAGAYSTGGNAGADGVNIWQGTSSSLPKSPALLHMNRIGFAKNIDLKSATRVLMHEFGHHWLYAFNILENGQKTRVLSPDGGHPAQYVDTRAAFTVYDSDDASVMGGGHFDESNGSFRSSKYSAYGYSWIDLYLMGLAAPDEVKPSFYIANSSPPLGLAYFPPELSTFRGTGRSVVVDQIVGAMGPRTPAYPATQREFTLLVVILDNAVHPLTDDDFNRVQSYRASFEQKFAAATGFRAAVATARVPIRRRAVR